MNLQLPSAPSHSQCSVYWLLTTSEETQLKLVQRIFSFCKEMASNVQYCQTWLDPGTQMKLPGIFLSSISFCQASFSNWFPVWYKMATRRTRLLSVLYWAPAKQREYLFPNSSSKSPRIVCHWLDLDHIVIPDSLNITGQIWIICPPLSCEISST